MKASLSPSFSEPHALRELLLQHADSTRAAAMHRYMKGNFPYFGIPSPLRRELLRTWKAELGKPDRDYWISFMHWCWDQPEREWQYAAMDMMKPVLKTWQRDEIALLEAWITTKSWWDTVDLMAAHGVGSYFKQYPDQIASTCDRWYHSGNLWLQRTVLIFQLGYGPQTDKELLFHYIHLLSGHRDFFIRKAIGWALRQLSKSDPLAVKELLSQTQLSPLSVREASKYL